MKFAKFLFAVLFVLSLVVPGYAQEEKTDPLKLSEVAELKLQIIKLKQQSIQSQYQVLRQQIETQFTSSDQVKQLQAQMDALVQDLKALEKSILAEKKLDEAKFKLNYDKGAIEEIPTPKKDEK